MHCFVAIEGASCFAKILESDFYKFGMSSMPLYRLVSRADNRARPESIWMQGRQNHLAAISVLSKLPQC